MKDIGSPSLEAAEVKGYYEAVTVAKSGLISYAKDEKRDKCKDILLRDVLIGFVIALIVGIMVWRFI